MVILFPSSSKAEERKTAFDPPSDSEDERKRFFNIIYLYI